MTDQPIKILIVDDNERARDKLIDQLRFSDVAVVGESSYGAAAYSWAEQLDVDVIIVAIEEPVARALRTVEMLAVGARSWPVLGVSTQADRETMRKAILAGVRDYLVQPVSDDELHQTIVTIDKVDRSRRTAVAQGQTAGRIGTIVAVTGVKGGIGKSTVSSNIAISLAEQTRQQIALVDLDLQFGDSAVMLDVVAPRTIEDAVRDLPRLDPQTLTSYLVEHPSRVKVLAAPRTPEGSERVGEDEVVQILEMLTATHDYVVVDTSAQIDAISVRVMDIATLVLLVVVPEVPCVRRTKAALTLMREWGYSRDKVKLVVNRARKKSEVSLAEIEAVLEYPVYTYIPDDALAVRGISIGAPVVISAPKSEAGRAFAELGRDLVGIPKPRKRGLLGRRQPNEVQPSDWDPTAPLAHARQSIQPQPAWVPSADPHGNGHGVPVIPANGHLVSNGPTDFSANWPGRPRSGD